MEHADSYKNDNQYFSGTSLLPKHWNKICTVGASAGDSCLQESTTRSYPKFEAVVDIASNDSVIHVASTTVLSAIVSLIG